VDGQVAMESSVARLMVRLAGIGVAMLGASLVSSPSQSSFKSRVQVDILYNNRQLVHFSP